MKLESSLLLYLSSPGNARQPKPPQKKWSTPITLLGGLCKPIFLQTTVPLSLNITVTVLCLRRSSAQVRVFVMTGQMSRPWLTEVLHDFDQVMNDDVGEGALAGEADNEMISMTENWVCHLLFRLEMTFISLTFQHLSCKCESDRDW